MSFSRLLKIIPATVISFVFIALTAMKGSATGKTTGVIENNSLIRAGIISFTDTTAWIDSLKKVIAKKYTWGSGGPAVIRSQKRYISANITLADFYAKKFYNGDYASLAPAEKYYNSVAILTHGTDGDLMDDISVIKMRDNGAKKLMRLYLSLKPTAAYREKLYKLVRSEAGVLRNESLATADKVSRYIFSSTSRFFSDPSLVPEDGEGICFYVNPVYPLSLKNPSNIFGQLDSLANIMKATPPLRLKVASRSSLMTMMEQQLLWEISNYVISYLVEKKGLASDRFLFVYDLDDKAGTKFRGMENLPVLTLSFAAEGEEGPSMVPPPMPHWKRG